MPKNKTRETTTTAIPPNIIDLGAIADKQDAANSASFDFRGERYNLRPMTKQFVDDFLNGMREFASLEQRIAEAGDDVTAEQTVALSVHGFLARQFNTLIGAPEEIILDMDIRTARKVVSAVMEKASLMGEQSAASVD